MILKLEELQIYVLLCNNQTFVMENKLISW